MIWREQLMLQVWLESKSEEDSNFFAFDVGHTTNPLGIRWQQTDYANVQQIDVETRDRAALWVQE
jgi:hypothetical protein